MKKKSRSKSKEKGKSMEKGKTEEKGKSKSRSKSREKSIPKYFKLSQKSVLLTYARTDKTNLKKADLGNYLYGKYKLKVLVVAEEHHKDGNPHLHAWLEWEELFSTRDPREFDYKNHHPNIGKIKDAKKNTRENALKYLTKEDSNCFCKGIDLKEWLYTNQNHRKYIAEDLVNEKLSLTEAIKYNPSLIYEYGKLKAILNLYHIDTKETNNEYKTDRNIWLYGKPGTGKTYYAVNNYVPYFKKPQNKWWDGYNNEPNVIIDDLDCNTKEFLIV